MQDFLKIVITSPDLFPKEELIIPELLETGVDYVHIRKPEWSIHEVERLIQSIPSRFYPKLKLHSCFDLIRIYGLGGAHLNHRFPIATPECGRLSKSCHAIAELEDCDRFEYQFLSPVFDSISKENYKGRFDLAAITSDIKGKNVVALGGITPDKFEELRQTGFRGGALLGYIWRQFKDRPV